MTTQEMIIGVNLGVQRVDAAAYDDVLDEEILYYLNRAQREFIRRQDAYLYKNIPAVTKQDVSLDKEAVYNLGSIITTKAYAESAVPSDQLINPTTPFDNGNSIPLPTDFFSFVYGKARYSSSGPWVNLKTISPSEINMYMESDGNSPIFRRFPVLPMGGQLHILYDHRAVGLSDVLLTYIKTPATLTVDVNSELPEHTHDEIVNLAVAFITEDLKSARPYEQNQQTLKGESQ